MRDFDVCVIGAGGVVGAAIVRELSMRSVSVAGLEKHRGPVHETSGHNSTVIHSGFHERPGTIKAQLTARSSRRIAEFCRSRGVPILRTGMLIAIPSGAIQSGLWRELGSLWSLWRGGRKQDISFQWLLTNGQVRRIAPIAASGGIFIPSVYVIDVFQYVMAMQRESLQNGAELHFGCEARAIGVDNGCFVVDSGDLQFRSPILINSAGLSAADISRMAGGPTYEVERLRGEYYELKGGVARWGIRTLVYPAMPDRSRSKGIHFGPRVDGRLFIGPDASTDDAPTPKEVFLNAARRFVPDVEDSDLEWAYAGIRPKHTLKNGVSDFVIQVDRHNPALINLIGIDSPGLSASMGLAEHVANLVREMR